MIKAETTSIQMTNIGEVADALKKKGDWTRKYKIVSAVYVGKHATVLCSREAGTELTLSAKADILQAVEAGKANVALAISSNKSGVFHSVGETGVIALELFKLKLIGGGVNTLNVDVEGGVEHIDPMTATEERRRSAWGRRRGALSSSHSLNPEPTPSCRTSWSTQNVAPMACSRQVDDLAPPRSSARAPRSRLGRMPTVELSLATGV